MSDRPSSSNPGSQSQTVDVWLKYLIPLFLWTIGLVLFLHFFEVFKMMLWGVLLALIAAAALRPLKQVFPGPRWWTAALSALLPAILVAVFVSLLSWFLSEPITREIARWSELGDEVNRQLSYWSERFGLSQPITMESIILQLGRGIDQEMVVTTATILINILLAVIFIFFGALFVLGEAPGRLISPIMTILPEQRRRQLRAAVDELEPRFRWWLIGTSISMTTVGLASFLGYWAVGLRFAAPIAVLAGLSEIVPTFGPLFAFLFALMFAASQGKAVVIGVLVVYAIIQSIESNLLTPFVMKQAVHMPPVVTLFTVILWLKVFGIPGLVLAIPLNIFIWTLFDHFLLRTRQNKLEAV